MNAALKFLSLSLLCSLTAIAHANGPKACSIQAFDGHYLTAVGGGGRNTDVIHSDANRFNDWERFTLVAVSTSPVMKYGIRTVKGNYLTAVGGGGRTTDVIHSDATRLQAWEMFTLVQLSNYTFALQTLRGNYLTVQDSGGRVTDVIHSNATRIGTWEQFRIVCGL